METIGLGAQEAAAFAIRSRPSAMGETGAVEAVTEATAIRVLRLLHRALDRAASTALVSRPSTCTGASLDCFINSRKEKKLRLT